MPFVSHFAAIASTASTLEGSTTASIRSCDSLTITSNGSRSGFRFGTFATSSSRPTPPAEAISPADEVRPAAPRSWSETSRSEASSSRQHSMTFFSSKGSPICTVGRFSMPSSSSAEARTDAPPMPSRPVEAPSRTIALPTPAAAARTIESVLARPTHIALTRQFCS